MNPTPSLLLVNDCHRDHKLAWFGEMEGVRDSSLAFGNVQLKGTSTVTILTTFVRRQER